MCVCVCVCVCVRVRAGNYRTQLYDKQKEEYLPATQGLGMFVEVKDPDEKVLHHSPHSAGAFGLCSQTDTRDMQETQRNAADPRPDE